MIKNKSISIVGFGNQGYAWALNMRDTGIKVKVALKTGSKSIRKAIETDLEVVNLKQAFLDSDIICMLTPDETHREIFDKYGQFLDEGQSIVFAHGFNVQYKRLELMDSLDLILVSPKGTGDSLRQAYLKDTGVPCLIAVERDYTGSGWKIAQEIAESLGCHRVGIYKSTFKEETEINLFSEQAFYLSVLPGAIRAVFDTLAEAGYSKEAAYWESLHKIKVFGDLISKHGLLDSYEKVSSVARTGGILAQERLLGSSFKNELKKILKEISSDTFIKNFSEQESSGFATVRSFLGDLKESQIETVGSKLRGKVKRYE